MAAHRKIAMHPKAGKRAPVAFDIARIGLPQALGQSDRRLAEHQFADFAGRQALAGHVHDVRADTERRTGERTGVHRMVRRPREDATSNLGAAGNVDDWKLSLADMLEEPLPRRVGPCLAARRGHTQARQIVALDVLRSIAHQTTDYGGGYSEIAYAMILDQPPESSSVRKIRRAFGDQKARARETGNTRAHRADHPAHVTEEEKTVRRFEIGADDHVACDHRTDEADMGPNATLRFAGGSRSVQQNRGIFRFHFDGRDRFILAGDDIVPPVIAALPHRSFDLKAFAIDDDHVLHCR